MSSGFERDQWGRRWGLRGVRLSLLVGLLCSVFQVWNDFSLYRADVDRVVKSELGYECAARLTDDVLKHNQNEFGNINVRKFGCADNDFYVSLKEIQDVRSGTMKFAPYTSPFNPGEVVIAAVTGVVVTLLFAGGAIGLLKVMRWVWGR